MVAGHTFRDAVLGAVEGVVEEVMLTCRQVLTKRFRSPEEVEGPGVISGPVSNEVFPKGVWRMTTGSEHDFRMAMERYLPDTLAEAAEVEEGRRLWTDPMLAAGTGPACSDRST